MNRYGFSKKFVAGLGMAIGLELALSVGMAAEGVPEICAASIVAENQTLVYGANFDDEALAVHVQHRPQPVKDEQPPGTEELAASFERFRSGKAELPAVPDGKDRGWRKVEHKEASILLCDTLNPWWYPGVKILRVRNTHGVSKPYRAGVPEIWGASPREVFPGESLTVWGVNIGEQFALRSDKSGKVEIRKGHRPYNTHSHRPELQFIRRLIVPENMGAGEYSLYNWRDFGDAGWSEPISIRVASRPEQPKAIVNVKDNGAAGDGVKDDTEAVLKAIARAKELDGWVLLPAGRYVVSQSLELPEGVRLIGHGAESTVIESSAWKTFAEGAQFPERVLSRPPDYDPKTYQRTGWGIDWRMAGAFQTQTYMVWLKSYSGLENITLDARNSLRINPVVLVADDHGAVCRNPVIRNCRILGRPEGHFADGPDRYAATYAAQGILSAGSTEDMVIEHTVIATPDHCINQMPGYNRRARIRYNTFTTLDPHSAYSLWMRRSMQDSLIEANVFENGGRSTTQQTAGLPYPAKRNCYLHNIFRNNRNGDGEQLMEETGSMHWFGQVGMATATSISGIDAGWAPTAAGSLHGARDAGYAGYTAVIMGGKGFGQFRTVVSNTADTLAVDKPWQVVPDQSTTFGIMWGGVIENLYIGNEFFFSQFYCGIFGSGLRNAWVNEVMESVGGGTWLQPIKGARVMYFNLIYGNKYHERAGIVMTNQRTTDDKWPPERKDACLQLWKSVGNEVRGCSVRARAYMPAKGGIETSMIRNAWTKHKDKCGIEPILCGMDTDMAFLPGREAAMAVWDSLCWGGYPTEDALEKLPPSTRWNLFADNMIIKCPVGIMIGKAVERTIISKNVYLDCAEPVLDLGRDTVIMDDFVKNPAE